MQSACGKSFAQLVVFDDKPYRLEKVWFKAFDITRLFIEYSLVTGGGGKLDYHKKHYLRITELAGCVLQHSAVYLSEIHVVLSNGSAVGILEKPPAKVLGNKCKERLVLIQLPQDIVQYADYLVLKRHCPKPR